MARLLQNIKITARAYGLETCPQQACCDSGEVVHRELAFPPVAFSCPVWPCGMRICRRTRAPL